MCLPSRESFYSSLTVIPYPRAITRTLPTCDSRFSIRTLGEYSDLYLKTNVLLLADIFENFRDSCAASYEIDPAYYYTRSGFTWDAMLKHTRVNFELLTDIDMVMFVERGICGGLSQCSNTYARVNNTYMLSYDPSKSWSYLMYIDVNLYGWAMCQPLSYADFRWVDDTSNFNVIDIALDSPTGYILEVDLEYPQHLHDVPFCPTGRQIWRGSNDRETKFPQSKRISESLVAIEMRKLEVKFNKPIYVGMCILDISKTCLYEFHHDYMLPMYRARNVK